MLGGLREFVPFQRRKTHVLILQHVQQRFHWNSQCFKLWIPSPSLRKIWDVLELAYVTTCTMFIFPSPFLTAHHPCLLIPPSCSPGTWAKEAHPDSSSKSMSQLLYAHIFSIYFLRVWIFFLHVCLCTIRVPDAPPGNKRTSDPLELHLETVVSHQVAPGIEPGVLCKSKECSKLLSLLSSVPVAS